MRTGPKRAERQARSRTEPKRAERQARTRTAPTRTERQARTRTELIDAAERLVTAQGYHATSLDAVADDAGYTKGAVYSNFASKEDLFFAVYERRAERFAAEAERRIAADDDPMASVRLLIAETAARRGRDDGWLAAFYEFWTHVVRHPEHRARFAAIHARAVEPFVGAMERFARARGIELPLGARQLSIAMYAMGSGLFLERLIQPDVVDADLGSRMLDLWLAQLAKGD
jgi:AcrR family transcriptional regulator